MSRWRDFLADREPADALRATTTVPLSLVFFVYCLVTALLILHVRLWELPVRLQVGGCLTYSAFCIGAIAFGSLRWKLTPLLVPSVFLSLVALPVVVELAGAWLLPVLATAGIAGVGAACWQARQTCRWWVWVSCMGIGAGLAALFFVIMNGAGYAHVFADISGVRGDLHRDTYFHAAIVNMLRYFSVPSTGLDGLVPISYHVGVHRWLAQNLAVLGGSTPLLLAVAQQVVFVPMFLFSLVLAALQLTRDKAPALIVLAVTLGLLWTADAFAVDSYLLSESYAYSLPLFLAMVPVGRAWLQRAALSIPFTEIVVALLSVIACGTAKLSSGVMLGIFLSACALGPIAVRDFKRVLPLGLVVGATGIMGTLALGDPGSYTAVYALEPFHLLRTYPRFLVVQAVVVLACSVPMIWLVAPQNPARWMGAVLLGIFVAGAVPGNVLAIAGASGLYFTHPVVLMSVAFGSAMCIDTWRRTLLNRSAGWLAAFAAVTFLLFVGSNLGRIGAVLGFSAKDCAVTWSPANHAGAALASPRAVGRRINNATHRLCESLAGLWQSHDRERAAVYIPPELTEFWDARRPCWLRSLVVPALVGLPLINGVRSGTDMCPAYPFYGMQGYPNASQNHSLNAKALRLAAARTGFDVIYVVSPDGTVTRRDFGATAQTR